MESSRLKNFREGLTGTERIGTERNGKERKGTDRNRQKQTVTDRNRQEQTGTDRNGKELTGSDFKQNITVNFIIQNLKNKHTFLKKYTN